MSNSPADIRERAMTADDARRELLKRFPTADAGYQACVRVATWCDDGDLAYQRMLIFRSGADIFSRNNPEYSDLCRYVANAWREAVVRIRPEMASFVEFFPEDTILLEAGYRDRPKNQEATCAAT